MKGDSTRDVRGEPPLYNIAAVERETGLSKDTLRVWERRYGFPRPARDGRQERVYSQEEVRRLRLLRLLLDQGERPAKIIHLDAEALTRLITRATARPEPALHVREAATCLLAHDTDRFRRVLLQGLMKQGLQRFVTDTVASLNAWIGEAWLRGEVAIFDEHVYSEHVQNILRNAILAQPGRGSVPRVLLTTLPGERHRIGLLMVEALLTAEGATCVALGSETPVTDIAEAARAYDAEVVALSFSAALSTATALAGLRELRAALPDAKALWAGGAGVSHCRRAVPGVALLRSFDELYRELARWRAAAAARPQA